MFGEGIINRLHENCSLRDTSNPVRPIIINTIGEWLDNHPPEELMEGVYLQSATGKYLDLFGKDLGVARRFNESDEHYRSRLVYESLGYLTVNYLNSVFDLNIYSYVPEFNVETNVLTSDNPYINLGGFMLNAGDDAKISLSKKFITGTNINWVNDDGSIDFILSVDEKDMLNDYIEIYGNSLAKYYFYQDTLMEVVHLTVPAMSNGYGLFRECSNLTSVYLKANRLSDARYMFRECTSLTGVDLVIPYARNCYAMFQYCTSLETVDLELPRVTSISNMFRNCTGLTNVELTVPSLNEYNNCFYGCTGLESINITLPEDLADGFISYVTGLSLPDLESFVVNGEPVI